MLLRLIGRGSLINNASCYICNILFVKEVGERVMQSHLVALMIVDDLDM